MALNELCPVFIFVQSYFCVDQNYLDEGQKANFNIEKSFLTLPSLRIKILGLFKISGQFNFLITVL